MSTETQQHYERRKISQKRRYAVDPLRQTKNIWRTMIRRCHDNRHDAFRYYGAEGISVCERWRESFDHFLKDVGMRPAKRSLNRIKPHLGYEPGNVEWATHSQQMRHRRLPVNSIPSCTCGRCAKCRNRDAVRRYQNRKKVA